MNKNRLAVREQVEMGFTHRSPRCYQWQRTEAVLRPPEGRLPSTEAPGGKNVIECTVPTFCPDFSYRGTDMIRVVNRTRSAVLGDRIAVANTPDTRNRGLLKHSSLEKGEGLWIVPTQSIHMFFMKFALDIVYLNKAKRVVKIVRHLKPWRISLCLRAHSVLELPAGVIDGTGTEKGDQMEFEKVS